MVTPVVVTAISDPPPRARTCGMTALVTRKTPVRLTSRHSCQRFSGVDSTGPSHNTPALATRTSMPPNSATAVSTAVSTDASLVTSHATGSARPPLATIPSATEPMVPGSLPRSSERAATATDAPAAARDFAIVAPMPRLAPATNAVFPRSVFNAVTAGSFGREPQPAVEADDLAIEVVVFDDALGELGVLGRTAH